MVGSEMEYRQLGMLTYFACGEDLIYLFIYLFIHLFIYLFVYLFIYS